MAYCTSKISKYEKGEQKLPLLAFWPEGPRKKCHYKLIINNGDGNFILFYCILALIIMAKMFIKNKLP
jgi:hypothetical protein